jgi:O-methyltransferase involved in polyketide biosynthesis
MEQQANPARIYDFLLGGKDNFSADRKAAKRLIAAKPDLLSNVRANRAFLARAVHYLAADAGISQFLDIGAGIPAMNNTHEIAQRALPSAAVVYADNDPEVLIHARALLTSTDAGTTGFVEADLHDPEGILALAGQSLDLAKPVAILLLGILYLIPDGDGPYEIVARLLSAAAPGSYLAISHPASDIHAEPAAKAARIYAKATGIPQTNRTRDQVGRFLDGTELIDPGVCPLNHWRPGPADDITTGISSWAAVGRKP